MKMSVERVTCPYCNHVRVVTHFSRISCKCGAMAERSPFRPSRWVWNDIANHLKASRGKV